MTSWKRNPGAPANHEAPPNEYMRPRGRHLAWQDQSDCKGVARPRTRVLKMAAAQKRWSRARTEGNKRLRIGDPEVQPPPIVKPTASASPLGHCPDDEDAIPFHKRQKVKP